ncbi:MAG: glycosyltransferase family 39 protein [Anaerolineae bacterium]|jgi:uncharacterized membrane protein
MLLIHPELWYTAIMDASKQRPGVRTLDRKARRNRRLVLWMLILLALGLRLARLTFQPLWWDEGWSLYFAATDLGAMLNLTAVDIHPPFYYLLLQLWTQVFGPGPLSVRLLSALVGTATVPLLYATGKRLLGEKAGLLAAFLLAISPFHIYYSQEVRMYGLVTLLGLAAFYFALRCESGPSGAPRSNWGIGRSGNLVGYVLAATAALYTQYYAVFLLLALNLAVLVRHFLPSLGGRGDRHTDANLPSNPALPPGGAGGLLPWLGAQLAVALLYLPWLWYAGEKLVTYVGFKISVEQDPSLGLLTYLGRHLAAFTWGHAEGLLAEWWWVGLLPLAALFLLLVLRRMAARYWRLGIGQWSLVIVVITLACGFVVNLVLPFNPPRLERLLLLTLPAYLLLIAGALQVLWRRHRLLVSLTATAFVVLGLLSLVFFYTVPRYPDDYRPVAERVRALGLPGDVVVCVHPWQVGYLQAYFPADGRLELFLTPREVIPRERQLWADAPALMAAELDRLLVEHGRLWLLDHRAMGRVLESEIEAHLLEHGYHTLSEWNGQNTVLSLFVAGEPAAQPITARFGEWLTLESAALTPGPLESGWGVVAIDLTWQLSEQPVDDYAIGLRLVGQTGHVWAQRDSPPNGGLDEFAEWPAGEPRQDHHGLLVPVGTPPGDYRLTLRVYRSDDVSVLPVTFEGGGGGEVTLGSVRVVRPETPPPVEALPLHSLNPTDVGDRLRLLGYAVHDESVRVGESVDVDLFWQALADPGEDFLPKLQLVAGDDVIVEWVEKPVAGTYPTAWWQAGDLVRDPHELPIPATVLSGGAEGFFDLELGLIRASDGQLVEFESGETILKLANVKVVGRRYNYEPPSPKHDQVARLGASVELVGYDLGETAPTPGSSLDVRLHWHALETPDKNYHAFVHLLDAEGNIMAQADGPPGSGEYPTRGWLPGEYVTDPHVLQFPPDLPAGAYRLAVGLYDPATGVRLGERVSLDTPVEVSENP